MHSWDLLVTNGCPIGRHGHTMVSYKNKLYMFGGHNGITATNELHIYDLVKNMWVEGSTSGTAPSPRFSHSAAIVNGKLYIFGGSRLLETADDLHALDLETLIWTQPTTSGSAPGPRCAHSAFTSGSKMIIFGGMDSGSKMKYSNDVFTLDTTTLCWKREETSGYSIPGKECRTSALVGHCIYVFSWALFPVCLETHILDLNTMTWSLIATDGQYPESEGFTACVLGSSIVTFGGKELSSPYSVHSKVLNDAYIFCTRTCTWSQMGKKSQLDGTISAAPSARYSHSACAWNGKMIIFGGCSGYRKEQNDLYALSWHHEVPSLTDLCVTTLVERTPHTLPHITSLPAELFLLLFQRMAQHRKLTLPTLPLFLRNPAFPACGTVSLAVCGNVVDDEWLHTIAQLDATYTQRWETLDISNCKLVTNKGLRKLTCLPNLKTLLADVESRITHDGLKMFKDHLPGVDVVLCRQSTPVFKVN
eukprot:Phypoly_transcript_07236.p1 GENE.Phypoly_transcript_07236~~Phypoly_transcript_07236.p1  ORF type:complete len:476 (+),score=58.91 Phypoly_transcript_07236:50-1477(+)